MLGIPDAITTVGAIDMLMGMLDSKNDQVGGSCGFSPVLRGWSMYRCTSEVFDNCCGGHLRFLKIVQYSGHPPKY